MPMFFLTRIPSQSPCNVYLDFSAGTTLPEVCGKKIDVRATVQLIMEVEPYTCHDPVYVVLDPEITVDSYRGIKNRFFHDGFRGRQQGGKYQAGCISH